MMQLFFVFGITLGVLLLVILGMAVGVLMGRKSISGSCGGLNNPESAEGGSCSLCSQPSSECSELKSKMQAAALAASQSSETQKAIQPDCEKDCEAEGCSKEAIDACKDT